MVWHAKLNGWRFPGGRVEVGESPYETAKREIMEEVGLSIDPQQLGIYDHLVNGIMWRGHYFVAKMDNPIPMLREPLKSPYIGFLTADEIVVNCTDTERLVLKDLRSHAVPNQTMDVRPDAGSSEVYSSAGPRCC